MTDKDDKDKKKKDAMLRAGRSSEDRERYPFDMKVGSFGYPTEISLSNRFYGRSCNVPS